MLLTVVEVAALVALMAGLIAALLDYLRGSTVFLIFKLAWQGSIKLRGLALSPVSVRETEVVQPPRIGGHSVFKCERVVLDSGLTRVLTARPFEVLVHRPFLDWSSDADGDSHMVKLLQDAGFIKEVQAKQQPERLAHPKGWKEEEKAAEDVVTRGWEAEVRAYTARVLLRDGVMQASRDFGMVLGDHLRVKALVGVASLAADAKETASSTTADQWWQRSSWPAASDSTGRPKYPLAAAAASDNVTFELSGWRTTTGLLLHRPIQATFQFTPSIADYMLARLSPLLGSAVGLEQGDAFSARLTPLEMHLPAQCYAVRVEPLKLVLATKGVINGVLALLNKGSGPKAARLEAWTSALEAEIYKDGLIVSKRLDLIVGIDARNGQGVHLVAWGKVDTGRGSAMDMTLGVPAASLRPLGLRDLPADYVFPIAVRGTSAAPQIDFVGAGKQLAELALKHHATQALPFMRGLFERQEKQKQAAGPAASAAVPPAKRPFPWEREP